jgi:hypothetical protein
MSDTKSIAYEFNKDRNDIFCLGAWPSFKNDFRALSKSGFAKRLRV